MYTSTPGDAADPTAAALARAQKEIKDLKAAAKAAAKSGAHTPWRPVLAQVREQQARSASTSGITGIARKGIPALSLTPRSCASKRSRLNVVRAPLLRRARAAARAARAAALPRLRLRPRLRRPLNIYTYVHIYIYTHIHICIYTIHIYTSIYIHQVSSMLGCVFYINVKARKDTCKYTYFTCAHFCACACIDASLCYSVFETSLMK